MNLQLQYMYKDHIYGDDPYRPYKEDIQLDGKRGKIFCTYYVAGGEGLHPTVILCHGYPGNEQNLDIAHLLRRIGCNVMTFHYSGSWGSEGNFSLKHCVEDTESILDLLLTDDHLRADKERIWLFGHSMGGFVGFHMLVRRKELAGAVLAMPCDFGQLAIAGEKDPAIKKEIIANLQEGADWLQGIDGETLYQECREIADHSTFVKLADRITEKPVLLIGGVLDTITPVRTMIQPLVDRVRELGGTRMEFKTITTDHMFADERCTVSELTARFLERQA